MPQGHQIDLGDHSGPEPMEQGTSREALLARLNVTFVGVLLLGTPLAREMHGTFSDRPIQLREWMTTYNAVVIGVHLLFLAGWQGAAWRISAFSSLSRRAIVGARMLLGFAAAAHLVMALLPWWLGRGPFAPDAPQIQLLRELVFMPPLARDAAVALLVLVQARARWVRAAVCGLFAVDAVASLVVRLETPKAVIALLHACANQPLLLAPFALILLLALHKESARPGERCSRV
jgi:hypothetical protein